MLPLHSKMCSTLVDKPHKLGIKSKFPNHLYFRYEYYVGDKVKQMFYAFQTIEAFLEWQKDVPDENRCFYEVSDENQPVREFYDLDGKISELPENMSWEELINLFCEARKAFLQQSDWQFGFNPDLEVYENDYYVCCEANDFNSDKLSLHLIFFNNYLNHKRDRKLFYNLFNTFLNQNQSKYPLQFDYQASINSSLRILGSHKIGQPHRKMRKTSTSNDRNYFILDVDKKKSSKFTYFKPDSETIISEPKLTELESFSEQANAILTEYIKDNFVSIDSAGLCKLKRVKPSECPICNRTHTSDNQYAFCKDGAVYLGCCRSEQKLFLGRFADSTEKTKFNLKDYLKTVTNRELDYFFDIKADKLKSSRWVTKLDKFLAKNKAIAISAYMGMGKTQGIVQYMKKLDNNARIICFSPRRSFAVSIGERFNRDIPEKDWTVYLSCKGAIVNPQNLIISIESLTRLEGDLSFDLVVLDEVESILTQLTSVTTNRDRIIQNINIFLEILKLSNKIILADAFLSNKTISFFRNVEIPVKTIQYTRPPEQRDAFEYEDMDKWMKGLCTELNKGKKVFCYTSSKTKQVEVIVPSIKKHCPDVRIKEYNGGSKLNTNTNVNDEWTQYDLVITTSATTVGVNFDEVDYFDSCFIYSSASSQNRIRDVFQAHMRVRHLADKELHFFVDPRPIGMSKCTQRSRILIENQKKYDEINYYCENLLRVNFDYSHRAIRELVTDNELEHNLSCMCHLEVFNRYLDVCGYEVHNRLKIDDYEIIKVDSEIPYEDIPEITNKEKQMLLKRRFTDILTTIEWLSIKKFNFLQISGLKAEESKASSLWPDYNKGAHKFHNISKEKGVVQGTANWRDFNYGDQHLFSDGIALKLFFLKKLCKVLEINNTQEEVTFSREFFESKLPELQKLEKKLRNFFNLRQRRDKKVKLNVRSGMDLINSVLDKWGFSKLKSGKRERKQVDGVRRYITPIKIEGTEHWKIIKGFVSKGYLSDSEELMRLLSQQ